MITFDIPASVSNPVVKINECLNVVSDRYQSIIDDLQGNIETLKYHALLSWGDEDGENVEELEERIYQIKNDLEEVEETLAEFQRARREVKNATISIANFTKEAPYTKGNGLHEINLFGEEISVSYWKRVIVVTQEELPSRVIKEIEEELNQS